MPHDPEDDSPTPELADEELDAHDDLDEQLPQSALVLRPREPMLSWVREVAPEAGEDQRSASVVALIPRLRGGPDLDRWLEQFHETLFREQFAAWTPEESKWPADRSLQTLRDWFEIEFVPLPDDFTDLYLGIEATCDPVPIDLLVDATEELPEGGMLYVDVQTGAIVSLDPDDLSALDDEDASGFGGTGEEFDSLVRRIEAGTLVAVVGEDEIDTVDIMHFFAENVKIAGVRNRLLDALATKKPERRFKEALDAAGLRRSWRVFHRGVIASMLVDLLDDYRIPYTPYTGDRSRQS
jgi:hypothetical protein